MMADYIDPWYKELKDSGILSELVNQKRQRFIDNHISYLQRKPPPFIKVLRQCGIRVFLWYLWFSIKGVE